MQRLTSLCYSLVDVPSLFLCVLCGSGKAPAGRVQGAFSCKRSSHWDHQAPVNWTFTYLCRSSGWTYCFNEEFISQRWGARFNEPLPGPERHETNSLLSARMSAALSCLLLWTHTSHSEDSRSSCAALWSEKILSVQCLSAFTHPIRSAVQHWEHGPSCLLSQGSLIVHSRLDHPTGKVGSCPDPEDPDSTSVWDSALLAEYVSAWWLPGAPNKLHSIK